jgi:hypothetical protein
MSYSATSGLPILLKLGCKDISDVGAVRPRTIIRREWLCITCLRLLFAELHGLEASWRILSGSADSNSQNWKVASIDGAIIYKSTHSVSLSSGPLTLWFIYF